MSDIDKGTWYQSAVSGQWYTLREAAGDICAVRIGGNTFYVGDQQSVIKQQAAEIERLEKDIASLGKHNLMQAIKIAELEEALQGYE